MIGVELCDAATGMPRADLAAEVEAAAEQEGVIVMRGGPGRATSCASSRPLVIDESDLDLALDGLERALERGLRARPRPPVPVTSAEVGRARARLAGRVTASRGA